MSVGEFFCKADHEAAEGFVAVEASVVSTHSLDGGSGHSGKSEAADEGFSDGLKAKEETMAAEKCA